MKKVLIFLAIAIFATQALAGDVPKWVSNAAAAGPHKLYATAPGDQGTCTYFQITAGSANITLSLHNYTNGSRSTGDDAWRKIEGATAAGDSTMTIYAGETVSFSFARDDVHPEAYYTSGGAARVWAK
jgi:hypothetical protein